jgi:hypothetical protein
VLHNRSQSQKEEGADKDDSRAIMKQSSLFDHKNLFLKKMRLSAAKNFVIIFYIV